MCSNALQGNKFKKHIINFHFHQHILRVIELHLENTKASNIILHDLFHITLFLSEILDLVAMAEGSNVKPVRYSVWVGKRNTPVHSLDEINNLLKANDFDVEVHSRNWENGGYIVSCQNFCFCFYVSFIVEV